jgi:hypothetical protein
VNRGYGPAAEGAGRFEKQRPTNEAGAFGWALNEFMRLLFS